MSYFFSCDWGTSAFRLRLINTSTLSVLAKVTNSEGCAKTNQKWLKENIGDQRRYEYYIEKIAACIRQIKQQSQIVTENIPLVISGMASSTIGMVNLPYKEIPFLINGSDLLIKVIEKTESFPHTTVIVSGVKTAGDVMRGEETKLIGCIHNDNQNDNIIVLPGTHPKHIFVNGNQVIGFKSYMTGEIFDVLSQKSLLALSVKESPEFDPFSFESGVNEGASGNLLHSSFLVRTNLLLGKYTAEQNFNYLSGLLLGSELKDLRNLPDPILLGSGKLGDLYQKAFQVLRINLRQIINADEALIKGQHKLLKTI